MFRILAALALLALVPSTARAFDYAAPAVSVTLGYCQVAVSTVVLISASCPIPVGAQYARIKADTAAFRYRDDGTAPTTAVGMPVAVGELLDYDGGVLAGLRVVAQTGTSTLNIIYYRY